jgi:hypothetical protein
MQQLEVLMLVLVLVIRKIDPNPSGNRLAPPSRHPRHPMRQFMNFYFLVSGTSSLAVMSLLIVMMKLCATIVVVALVVVVVVMSTVLQSAESALQRAVGGRTDIALGVGRQPWLEFRVKLLCEVLFLFKFCLLFLFWKIRVRSFPLVCSVDPEYVSVVAFL